MKSLLIKALLLGMGALVVTTSAFAHHSVSAAFDAERTIAFEGVVTKVDWFNPHIWFYLTVEGSDGTSADYQCEGSSPNALRRRGWTKDSLKIGDQISVDGLVARNAPFSCYAQVVKLADGTRLFSGNAAEIE